MVRFKKLEGSDALEGYKSMSIVIQVIPKGEFDASLKGLTTMGLARLIYWACVLQQPEILRPIISLLMLELTTSFKIVVLGCFTFIL